MKYKLTEDELQRFTNYLTGEGGIILPPTNEYEALRFRGDQVGVLYKSGKAANPYTRQAINDWKGNKKWTGRPISTGRLTTYTKQKRYIFKRDGSKCFYCHKELGQDITLEHLEDLKRGGRNVLSNMVLAHDKCNGAADKLDLVQKIKLAIKNKVELLNITT